MFEFVIMKWVDEAIEGEIDVRQLADVLVEMVHFIKATDKSDSYVRL